MRKIIASVLGVVCVTAVLGAQAKPADSVEKKATDNLWIDKDTKVGGQVVKAGEYRVTSMAGTVTFVRLRESQDPGVWTVSQEKAIEVPSKSTALPKRRRARIRTWSPGRMARPCCNR